MTMIYYVYTTGHVIYFFGEIFMRKLTRSQLIHKFLKQKQVV